MESLLCESETCTYYSCNNNRKRKSDWRRETRRVDGRKRGEVTGDWRDETGGGRRRDWVTEGMKERERSKINWKRKTRSY